MIRKIIKSKIAKYIFKIRKDISNKEIPYPENIPLPKDIVKDINDKYYSYSIWEIIAWLLKRSYKIIKLIIKVVQLTNWIKSMKDNSITTKFANSKLGTLITTVLTAAIALFGFDAPPAFISGLVIVGVTIYGWLDRKQGKATQDAE